MTELILGNTKISFYRTESINKNSLTDLYDVFNDIAGNSNIKRKDLFYTKEQVKELNKDTTNIFI